MKSALHFLVFLTQHRRFLDSVSIQTILIFIGLSFKPSDLWLWWLSHPWIIAFSVQKSWRYELPFNLLACSCRFYPQVKYIFLLSLSSFISTCMLALVIPCVNMRACSCNTLVWTCVLCLNINLLLMTYLSLNHFYQWFSVQVWFWRPGFYLLGKLPIHKPTIFSSCLHQQQSHLGLIFPHLQGSKCWSLVLRTGFSCCLYDCHASL